MKKKIISFVLAVVMVVSLLPVGAFADKELKNTVTFTDISGDVTIHPGEDVTLSASATTTGDYLYYLWFDADLAPVDWLKEIADDCTNSLTKRIGVVTVAAKYGIELYKYYEDHPELERSIFGGDFKSDLPVSSITLRNVTQTMHVQCIAVANTDKSLEKLDNPNIQLTDFLGMTTMFITGYTLSDVITITVDPDAPCRNHKLGEQSLITPATCTTAGLSSAVCSLCGETVTTEIAPLGHDFGEWIETVLPSCKAAGLETRYCSRCPEVETQEIAKTEHNYTVTETQPTCTESGYTTYVCPVCGDTYSTEGSAAIGHDFQNGKCTRCGEKDPDFVKAPKVSITTSAGKPKISWSAVPGATKYYIYKSTTGKSYSYVTATTKTSYTHSSASIGATYYYKVVAVKDGVKSDYSNVVSKQCVPAAPTVTIARSSGKAKLSWDKVSGATKYYIYRSTDGKTFKQLTSTTKTSYTDTKASSGKKYYYKVKAAAVVNDKNVYSSYSSVKSLLTTLATPTVKITTSSGKPKISWSKVTGADKYYIYRSTDGKTFKQLTTTTKTSYTNTSAKKNTKYYYKVKAVSTVTSSANSAQSKAVSIKATK